MLLFNKRKRLVMKSIKILLLVTILSCSVKVNAQYATLYPTNWWVGMKWNTVQILVKGNYSDFKNETVSIKYPGVTLTKVHKLDNGLYMALDVTIASTAKPGNVIIEFIANGKAHAVKWELKPKRKGNGTLYAQGVTSSDIMYLIMPDRFSNGDYTNDRVDGMLDVSLNRDSIYHRHGGDLQGIINHLDYFNDLGINTLWLNPVLENDMPDRTEHGYAITNHYKVDKRLGTNEKYKELVDETHRKGLKMIQDAVYNHVGLDHFFVKELPTKDWLNEWPTYTNTTYKEQTLFDPHASAKDYKQMADGWFTRKMPDLNQKNPYVANFLIQHAIWSVEEFGIDGWRIDTYSYNDLEFMNRCNKALENEYPKITLFGETWVHGVINQSYFCQNNFNSPFKSNLQATTDFQLLFYGIQEALTKPFGWTDGINKLYTTTAQDFVYKDPMRQVIFLDNHDLPRFYSVLGENLDKYKMSLSWLLTFRGIPQLYYGNEHLMTGFTNPDGWVRLDFKGGWEEDAQNKFTAEGRTDNENEIFNHIKQLTHFRNKSSAIKTGKLMQYIPVDGLYVYFRYDKNQTVMCIMNTSDSDKEIDFSNYSERVKGFTSANNILDNSSFQLNNKLSIQSWKMVVLELK
jgi:glycosidase